MALLLVACAHHGGGDDTGGGGALEGLVSLAVTPADQTLVIAQGQAATSGYVATGTFEDGHTADLTAYVAFGLEDPTLGAFTAAAFTTNTTHGGQTHVIAAAGDISGATPVTVKLEQQWNDPGSTLPGDPSGPFGGTVDPNRATTPIYPNDGVAVPPNLGRLEFHFYPGTNNTLLELAFESAVLDLKVYLRCTQPMAGGCIYLPDPQVWAWLAASARGGAAVAWTVRGTDDAGTGVGTSGAFSLRFTAQDLTGGIYYWTTTLQAIMRYDFASQTQTVAEKYLGTELTNGTCIGCHALSRDGTKLVAESGGQNDGRTLLLDVATKTAMVPYGSTQKSNFESWKPDGMAYAGVYADSGATNYDLMIFDGSTAALTATIPVGGSAQHPTDHPDWASSGDRIAFVNVGVAQTLQRMFNGEIRAVTNTGGTWGAPEVLVPRAPGKNRYYPAFAPDSKLLVFDESTCNSGDTGGECDADTDPTARLYAIDASAPGTPTELAHANAPGVTDGGATALANSFPKWNPNPWARDAAGGTIGWMTFSSTRKYGLRAPPSGGTLVWMTAVDLGAAPGTDPSAAAFVLPFQDIATSNHIAQWTTQVVSVQ